MISRFCRYIDKVFGFETFLPVLGDFRQKPRISTRAAFLSAFYLYCTGRKSLNAMETELLMPKRLDRLIGKRKPSADSMGRIVAEMYDDPPREMLAALDHRIKRNKALQTDWPLRFAALDGHEFFSLGSSSLR